MSRDLLGPIDAGQPHGTGRRQFAVCGDAAATQAESASVCMFPERKDCMHIFSTEGRAFFAVWLQAVEGCVSGYMAALRDEAWREAMATLRALVAALEEFMMESGASSCP